MKSNRPFLLGVYQLSYRRVEVWIDPQKGDGAWFSFLPDDKGPPKMVIGVDYASPDKPFGHLMHEAMEFCLDDLRCRYVRTDAFDQNCTDACWFYFDHNTLNEVAARVSYFISKVSPDFYRAWKRCKRRK